MPQDFVWVLLRSPNRDGNSVIPMIEGVKNLGLETCILGMLDENNETVRQNRLGL